MNSTIMDVCFCVICGHSLNSSSAKSADLNAAQVMPSGISAFQSGHESGSSFAISRSKLINFSILHLPNMSSLSVSDYSKWQVLIQRNSLVKITQCYDRTLRVVRNLISK